MVTVSKINVKNNKNWLMCLLFCRKKFTIDQIKIAIKPDEYLKKSLITDILMGINFEFRRKKLPIDVAAIANISLFFKKLGILKTKKNKGIKLRKIILSIWSV